MWTDLDVRHLLALRAVAEEGTFGKAATRLGFTQSAVSQQVAALEHIVGHTLFDRPTGPRRPTLTPSGALLLEHAERILGHLERAELEVDQFARAVAGRITIGTFQSVSTRLLPAMLRRLQTDAPGVEVLIREDDVDIDLGIGAMERGEIDLGFFNAPPGEGFDGVFVVADPYVAIVPPDEPPGPVRLEELQGRPMVSMPVGDACGRAIERRIEDAGVQPHVVFRSHDNGAVQAMVRAGIGIAVMPLLTIDANDPQVELRPIEPEVTPRQIWLVWPSGRSLSPIARRFVDIAGEVGADFGSEVGSESAVA